MTNKNGKEADEIRLLNPRVKAIFMSLYLEDIIVKKACSSLKLTFFLNYYPIDAPEKDGRSS